MVASSLRTLAAFPSQQPSRPNRQVPRHATFLFLPYKATLVTEGVSGNLQLGKTQKIYSGTVVTNGMNRADPGSVVRRGNGYVIVKESSSNDFNQRNSPYATEEKLKVNRVTVVKPINDCFDA